MPTVQDVITAKGGKVHSIAPTATVLEATQKMNGHKIGALVVMEGEQVVGIFTERDVLRRVVGAERRPSQILVSEVMTTEVVCCEPDMDLNEVSAMMQQQRVRHIPVCEDGGKLLGLVSIGDVNAHHASHQQATIHFLNDYIYGRV